MDGKGVNLAIKRGFSGQRGLSGQLEGLIWPAQVVLAKLTPLAENRITNEGFEGLIWPGDSE